MLILAKYPELLSKTLLCQNPKEQRNNSVLFILSFTTPTNHTHYKYSRQSNMIQQAVLPLNVIAAILHLALATIGLLVLKKAAKKYPTPHLKTIDEQKKEDLKDTGFVSVLAVGWLKKYTIIGSIFVADPLFLTKEILIIATFGTALTHINRITLWPCSLSLVILVTCFFLWEVLAKRPGRREVREGETKVMNNQAESQLDIQAIEIEPRQPRIIIEDVKNANAKENVKEKQSRTPLEFISIGILIFTALVLELQTTMTLSTSTSNSGELNLCSLLATIALDQTVVRIPLGLIFVAGLKIYSEVTGTFLVDIGIVHLFCSEEIAVILNKKEKERRKKREEMAASPPREKRDSPSRVPKAVPSAEKSTFLNLINLQPTKRDCDEVVQEVEFTPIEKDMFEESQTDNNNVLEQKNGFYTRRTRKQKDYQWHSAQKGATTIDIHDVTEKKDDILIFKDDPFDQMENVDEFWLEESRAIETRRRGAVRRKRNKRNLKLTGDSPYLQYLPNMLKKVDKYKDQLNKQGATKPMR